MSTEQPSLLALREAIDSLDKELHRLFNQRAGLAQQVAVAKQQEDPQAQIQFYRPEREAQVLRVAMQRNQGPLSDEAVGRLFRAVMAECLALESPLKVAYLGPAGTYTHAAALKHFGLAINCCPMASIGEVFREVEAGLVDYGVVPVENSTEGVVNHTLDSFVKSSLKICGEVELRIHHHLLVAPQFREQTPLRVYSHQQSLAQCRQWLDQNLPGPERLAVSSNAEAARRALDDPHALAIAGKMAADTYGLETKVSNIEDEPNNTTRFLIIGRNEVQPSGEDKTSLLVSTHNRPGSLMSLLEPFAKRNISLTRIESRPSRDGLWDYVFFIDMAGHYQDEPVAAVLSDLAQSTRMLKVLGSYPQAVL